MSVSTQGVRCCYDLVIVGGGLVGASLALALSSQDIKIALIDAAPATTHDHKLFALNQSSCALLDRIGVWPSLKEKSSPIHQVHVSQAGKFGALRLHREEVHLDALGYVIPSHDLSHVLNEKLNQQTSITLYRPATLMSLIEHDDSVTLTLAADDKTFEIIGSMVVGADGTESTVRKAANIASTKTDYQQSAIVTRTILNRPHEQIAYERFNAQGAIAMLPLINDECATIWTADNHTIKQLNALSDNEFLKTLQAQFGYRLGRLKQIKQRFTFPLHMVRAEKAYTKRIYLLGNALHTLHPIAAQGFNLALYEVAVLAEGIMKWMSGGKSFDQLQLHPFHERSETQQNIIINLSDGLSTFASSPFSILRGMMGLAMMGCDVIPPIKKSLIARMVGRAGKVPRLLLSVNQHEK